MPRPIGTVPFVQEAADFKIGEPVEIYIAGQLSSCMRLRDFREMHATATKRLRAYDANEAEAAAKEKLAKLDGEVLPFHGKSKKR